MEPVLQVALDHMHRKRALLAAKEAIEGGADWLEAGTPLIKSEGMEVVRELKKSFPGKTIVADLKTMDTGAFETEIAAKAGADVLTVMGVTDDATIPEAVAEAVAAGASTVIVGGAIIKAEKVADATRTIKKAMQGLKAISSGSFKKYTEADVRDALRKVSTPNLADAMQKRGVMTGLVPRIKHGAKLVGRAITVKT